MHVKTTVYGHSTAGAVTRKAVETETRRPQTL